MYFNIPNWPAIDLTASIDYLLDLLRDLWSWSEYNGFYIHSQFFSYRNIIIAGLVFGLFVSRIVGNFTREQDEAIQWAGERYNGRGSND